MKDFWKYVCFGPEGGAEGSAGDLNDSGSGESVASPAPAAPEGGEGDSAPGDSSSSPVAPSPPQSIPFDVFKKRVDTLSRKNAELEARLEQASQTQTPGRPAAPAAVDYQQEVIAAAAAKMRLDEKSNDIAMKGQELFPDFMTRVQTLNSTLGIISPASIEAVIEASGGDDELAARVFHELGSDLQRAASVLSLNPIKQGIALAKMADKIKSGAAAPKPKASAGAPAPIAPRQGGGSAAPGSAVLDLSNPKVSLDDWMAERNRTAKRRR